MTTVRFLDQPVILSTTEAADRLRAQNPTVAASDQAIIRQLAPVAPTARLSARDVWIAKQQCDVGDEPDEPAPLPERLPAREAWIAKQQQNSFPTRGRTAPQPAGRRQF